MASVPNDTTRFELAWLIIWILLTTALLALVVMRRLVVPQLPLFKGGARTWSIIFGALQFVLFVLLLACLAENSWTYYSRKVTVGFSQTTTEWVKFGLAGSRSKGDSSNTRYDCSAVASSVRTYCRTYQTAGAFTLIFGLFAIFSAFFLLLVSAVTLLGKTVGPMVHLLVPQVALVQFLCLQAMVLIWGVSGHDLIKQANSNVDLGASWALCFVCCVFAIPAALFYAHGPGVSARGDPALAAEPHVEPAVKEVPVTVA